MEDFIFGTSIQGINIIQLLIVTGAIIIIIYAISVFLKTKVNMDDHHKIQAISIVGLVLIAITALILVAFGENSENLITLTGVAIGGIAGFIAHKAGGTGKTALLSPNDREVIVEDSLEFVLEGISTEGNNLNYNVSSDPILPDTVDFNVITGKFSWIPTEDDVDKDNGNLIAKEYQVTFMVSDGMGGSDSKTIKITVKPKE